MGDRHIFQRESLSGHPLGDNSASWAGACKAVQKALFIIGATLAILCDLHLSITITVFICFWEGLCVTSSATRLVRKVIEMNTDGHATNNRLLTRKRLREIVRSFERIVTIYRIRSQSKFQNNGKGFKIGNMI